MIIHLILDLAKVNKLLRNIRIQSYSILTGRQHLYC